MLGSAKTAPMEILLVEDGLTDARMTIFAIRRCGVHHRLTLVRSIADARRFLRREGIFSLAPTVNLLLLDMMLPDGSGEDLLADFAPERAGDRPFEVPTTVVLTASDDPELRKRCTEAGVIDFIRKPVREDEFMRVVRDHKRLMIHTTAASPANCESTSLLTITP
ncbi:MAG: response regulator [Planctomycetota bacterium]